MANEAQMKLHMEIGANVLDVEGPLPAVTEILREWKRLIGFVEPEPAARPSVR